MSAIRDEYGDLIDGKAAAYDLSPALIEAVISVESGGDTWAYRPERRYRYFWDVARQEPFRRVSSDELANKAAPEDFPHPRKASRDAEWWEQQASFGLMQVMGAVAREHGVNHPFLTILCDPYVGVEIGCKHLAAYVDRYGLREGVAAYNAGPGGRRGSQGQAYADKVLARMEALS